MLHAAFVRSPSRARARRRRRRLGGGSTRPGVVAVLTGRDLAEWSEPLAPRLEAPGFAPTAGPRSAGSRVRFVGEPVAVVAAGTPYVGGRRVRARAPPATRRCPPLADVDAALARALRSCTRPCPATCSFERRRRQGDVERRVRRARRSWSRDASATRALLGLPLEPRGIDRALGGRCPHRLDGHAGAVHRSHRARPGLRARRAAACASSCPTPAAGFGQKMHVMPEDIAVAARPVVGRPVKWTETRRENFAAASQAREARVEHRGRRGRATASCSAFARASGPTPGR